MSKPADSEHESEADKEARRLKALIPDKSLRAMIDEQPDAVCSLIVEAKLPTRKFSMRTDGSKELVAEAAEEPAVDRDEVLAELKKKLVKFAGAENVNVLKTSGAIVIKVQAKQLKEISKTQNVRAIRPNRKLSPIRPQSASPTEH